MNIVGVICEFNPFHMGHKYLFDSIRETLRDDCAIVCVMSGNFVQRGEFAVFNKHARAKAAVTCGADLVLEMPLHRAIASAERFALGGVNTLNALGTVTHLAFGSECGSIETLTKIANAAADKNTIEKIKARVRAGEAFAAARQSVLEDILGSDAQALASPNNTLGIEYLKALKAIDSRILPVTITRSGDSHDSIGCSGMGIREQIFSGSYDWDNVPAPAAEIFSQELSLGRGPVDIRTSHGAMMSVMRRYTDFSKLPDISGGLDMRLKNAVASCGSMNAVLESAKTKSYTLARLRRMALCAYLGLTDEDIKAPVTYIKVLAMNSKGKAVLKDAAKSATLPIITKPAAIKKESTIAQCQFELTSMATDLYALAYPNEEFRASGQEWQAGPVII